MTFHDRHADFESVYAVEDLRMSIVFYSHVIVMYLNMLIRQSFPIYMMIHLPVKWTESKHKPLMIKFDQICLALAGARHQEIATFFSATICLTKNENEMRHKNAAAISLTYLNLSYLNLSRNRWVLGVSAHQCWSSWRELGTPQVMLSHVGAHTWCNEGKRHGVRSLWLQKCAKLARFFSGKPHSEPKPQSVSPLISWMVLACLGAGSRLDDF